MPEEIRPGMMPDPSGGDEWAGLWVMAPPTLDGSDTLYEDCNVWVVKITLQKKDNSGSATYYLSRDYYDEGELYSGSPVIYPIIAGTPEDLTVDRSHGREIAILHEPVVKLYGGSHFDDYGKCFFDLADEYRFHEADVEIRAYTKARDDMTTHSDSVNIRMGRLKVKNFQMVDGVLELGCRQILFKEKEISKRLEATTFTDLEEDYQGEYGAIVFGQDVVVEAPWIDSTANSSGTVTSEVFLGWTATGHVLGGFTTFYARNTEGPRDPEWVEIGLSSSNVAIHGNQYSLGAGDADGAVGEGRCVVFSPGPDDSRVLWAINVALTRTGTPPTSDDGNIRIFVARGVNLTTAGVYEEEQVLREAKFDNFNSSSLTSVLAFVYPPLVATENENYMIGVEWTNPSATEGYRVRYLTSGSNSNDNSQSRDNTTRGAGWTSTSEDPYIALYDFQTDTGLNNNSGTAPNKYAYYDLKATGTGSVSVSFFSDNSDGKMHYEIELKAKVDGLKDDGSGTYTGSANALIENPADLIRFLLFDDEIGLGESTSIADLTTFTTARTDLGDTYDLSFAVEGQTFATDLILKILRQTRLILAVNREGELWLKYPRPPSATVDHNISEGYWKDEMSIVSIGESSADEVLNDFEVPFAIDKLNTPKDVDIVRRLGRNASYSGVEVLNSSDSTGNDSAREAKAATSLALYGRRTYRDTFDLYGSDSLGPRNKVNYLFDRYGDKQTIFTVRVPFDKFKTADQFDSLEAKSFDLPTKNGKLDEITWLNGSDIISWFDEGIPITWTNRGKLKGIITGIRERGDDIEITVETAESF